MKQPVVYSPDGSVEWDGKTLTIVKITPAVIKFVEVLRSIHIPKDGEKKDPTH